MTDEEAKQREELNARSEASVRVMLRSKTWEEKVASIGRMREFSKKAKAAMREALAREGEGSVE